MSASILFSGVTAAVLLAAAMGVHGAFGWLVAAPFAFAQLQTRSWRAAVWMGVVFGVTAGIIVHAAWLAETAATYFSLSAAAAWLGAIGLALLTGATQGAALGLALGATARLRGVWALLAAGAVWALWEHLGLDVFPQYPWASLLLGSARSSAGASPDVHGALVLGAVSFLGTTGATFLLATAGTALGVALASADRRRPALGTAIGCLALVAVLGGIAARRVPPSGSPLCTIESIDAAVRGAAGSAASYAAATRLAARQWSEAPAIVVWPESSLETSPEIDAGLREQLQQLAAELGVSLVAGGTRLGWSASWNERRFNSAFVVDRDGTLRFYDKRRVVPLAEKWPHWIPAPPAVRSAWIEAGDRGGSFAVGGCRIGILICFEAEVPAAAADLASAGADVLLVLTNDAVLPPRPVQWEAAEARLRAAETGLPVVRAANAGQSFVALPPGQTDSGSRRLVVRQASLAPATAIAPWLLAIAYGVTAIALAAAGFSEWRC